VGERANQHLDGVARPQAEATGAHLKEAGTARLEHPHARSDAQTQLVKTMNQARITMQVGHFRPLTGRQTFERNAHANTPWPLHSYRHC
jgi:hypothetical protein